MFKTQCSILLSDTDAAGVIFFGSCFVKAHTAYEMLMDTIGCSLATIIYESDYFLPIVHAEADLLRPMRLGDKLAIHVQAKLGQTSFTLTCDFKDINGNLTARTKMVHVSVNKQTGTKMALPEKLRKGLAGIMELR